MKYVINEIRNDINETLRDDNVYISILKFIGTNAWIQFYSIKSDQITLLDFALFDTAEPSAHLEIYNPKHLTSIADFEIQDTGPHHRSTISFKTSNVTGDVYHEIYFRSCAFDRRTKPIHRASPWFNDD